MQCQVTIVGLPAFPHIKEVNIRNGPGSNFAVSFKVAVGTTNLPIIDRAPDAENKGKGGKAYRWLKLDFGVGAIGWVRDDLVTVQGDCSLFGYGVVVQPQVGFNVHIRQIEELLPPPQRATVTPAPSPVVVSPPPAPVSSFPPIPNPVIVSPPPAPVIPPPPVVATLPPVNLNNIPSSGAMVRDIEFIRKVSFAITRGFEGDYNAINTFDAGIVSFGTFQFTLAAGSLFSVLERYLQRANSDIANQLRGYLPRVQNRDANLRGDTNFHNLLRGSANDQIMRDVQDEIATEKYWDVVYTGYIEHRGLKVPLGWALLFDMGINFGTGHILVRMAEDELGVPRRSRPGENGVTEETLIAKIAELRKRSHDNQAARDNLPGLSARGDFWMDLVRKGDWNLQGDTGGFVYPLGKRVQVRNI